MKLKCLLILPLLLAMKSLCGDYISHDDFSDSTLDMNKWDTLAWSGGYEPYIENKRVVFKGSDNVSNLEGSLTDQYTVPLDSSPNSAILYKGEGLENTHGIEVELTLSSDSVTQETGLGIYILDSISSFNGFGVDLWNSEGTLNVEFFIEGDFQQGDPRFEYVSTNSGTGFVKFITNVAYDTIHKVAYILSDDGLVFYYNGVEVGRFADYDHTVLHESVVIRGCNDNTENFLGYVDNFKFYRPFVDTDLDGLHDDDETNTGTFVSIRDTGTNPNVADSSGDGLKDGVVVNAGFDPTVDYSNLANPFREGMTDLRAGSTIIQVTNNEASVQIQMEESSDLESWTEIGDAATMVVPADTDTKFFRFKMTE